MQHGPRTLTSSPARLARALPMLLALAGCQQEPVEVASNRAPLSVDKLDILLVVDDSGSMESVQEQLPAMLEAFEHGSHPSVGEFNPIGDIHLGVTTTDMGVGAVMGVRGCDERGNDGMLIELTRDDLAACQLHAGRYLAFDADGGATADVENVSCLAGLDTFGCGYEQPLEAAIKALWPSSGGPAFQDGTGHGDGANAGFLREDSLLIVIVVSDEDDCSAADPVIFTPPTLLASDDPLREIAINLRCPLNPDALHPIARYEAALKQLRPNNDKLLLAVVGGVPTELVSEQAQAEFDLGTPEGRDAYYQAILDAPAMQKRPGEERLEASCEKAGQGFALPPRRLVQTAQALDHSVVGSLCQEDFGPVAGAIIRAAAEQL